MSEGEIARRYLRMPYVEKGMAVGLFGGSFNPPHEGHVLVAEIAMRRLGLDQLWWMVTPGNPLKDRRILAPLADEDDAATLARRKAPAWTFIHGPRSPLSSTALRAAGAAARDG